MQIINTNNYVQKDNQYIDTMATFMDKMQYEIDRRKNAIKSNMFCDNKTSQKHIDMLNEGLAAMQWVSMHYDYNKGDKNETS